MQWEGPHLLCQKLRESHPYILCQGPMCLWHMDICHNPIQTFQTVSSYTQNANKLQNANRGAKIGPHTGCAWLGLASSWSCGWAPSVIGPHSAPLHHLASPHLPASPTNQLQILELPPKTTTPLSTAVPITQTLENSMGTTQLIFNLHWVWNMKFTDHRVPPSKSKLL